MAIYFLNAELNYPQDLVNKVTLVVSKYVEGAIKDLDIKKPFDVTIYPNHKWTEEIDGVDGDALSAGVLQIRLDLRNEKFPLDTLLETPLKGLIYHEMNHIARWQGPGYGWTLFEATISEGLATVYERMITEPYPLPHADYSNIEELLPHYKNRNKDEDDRYNHSSWFFGFDPKYPKYLGYKVGAYIIDQALTLNRSLSIKDMTQMDADEILKLSKVKI
jgi:hypothetical protein